MIRFASQPMRAGRRMGTRKTPFLRVAACWALAVQLAGLALLSADSNPARSLSDKPAAKGFADPVMKTMQAELSRASLALAKEESAPYYISYTVYDQNLSVIVGAYGSLLTDASLHRRQADVVMRVGSPARDNTHGQSRGSGMTSGTLPIGDDQEAIARVLWELTDREYKRAAPALLNVKTKQAVEADEDDKSPDFSKEVPQTHSIDLPAPPPFDRSAWQSEIRRLSGAFRQYPEVNTANVILQMTNSESRMVSSEGTAIESPSVSTRMVIEAQTRAEDGMDLLRVETFQAPNASGLPKEAELTAKIKKMAEDLHALKNAPVAEPYDGPALLSGRAAAVFFHEVLGHRLEGHRQRDEDEGQTFTKKVGQEVLPKFLSVTDDPTVSEMAGVKLAGAYDFDNEGVPSHGVEVIKDGVLKNFLMSRMPIKGFDVSNGHGRNQPGLMPTGRQGNLIISSTQSVPESQMRQKLIDEIKKQNKSYGLYFDDIQGGFTLTTRALPQAFQVLPVIVYKVYADGRPDELVRGVDIVGTPLAALTRILLTGDQQHVFNGVCGAESGQVPVSAVAPAMLFSEMEVQKRQHSHDRPPLLPPPGFENSPIKTALGSTPAKPEAKP